MLNKQSTLQESGHLRIFLWQTGPSDVNLFTRFLRSLIVNFRPQTNNYRHFRIKLHQNCFTKCLLFKLKTNPSITSTRSSGSEGSTQGPQWPDQRCITGQNKTSCLTVAPLNALRQTTTDWTLHLCNQSRKQRGLWFLEFLPTDDGPACFLQTHLPLKNCTDDAYCILLEYVSGLVSQRWTDTILR